MRVDVLIGVVDIWQSTVWEFFLKERMLKKKEKNSV